MVSHTGTILTAATADEDDTVLLDVVTLAGDICGNVTTVGESDTSGLTLAGVGLLRADNTDSEAYALHGGSVHLGQGGGYGVASALALLVATLVIIC